MNYVAVYGTLRKGGQNHLYIEHLCGEYVETVLVPDFPGKLIVDTLPKLVATQERNPIVFEVYKIQDLEVIDSLECHPNFYRRMLTEVGGYNCWVYYYINTNINTNTKDNIYDYIYYINTNNNKIAQDNTNVKSN